MEALWQVKGDAKMFMTLIAVALTFVFVAMVFLLVSWFTDHNTPCFCWAVVFLIMAVIILVLIQIGGEPRLVPMAQRDLEVGVVYETLYCEDVSTANPNLGLFLAILRWNDPRTKGSYEGLFRFKYSPPPKFMVDGKKELIPLPAKPEAENN